MINTRQSGFGVGHIPFSEIREYLFELHIFDFDERWEYIRWIQFLDREYVKYRQSEHERDAKKKGNHKGGA